MILFTVKELEMTKQPVIEFENDDIQLAIDGHLAIIKILSKNPWRNLFTDLKNYFATEKRFVGIL